MRAIWTGEIAFGLVTIPAKLYTATRDLTPQFTTLHKECGSKVQMVRRCPVCHRDVEFGELGKGYEVQKGTYALFTKEELEKIDDVKLTPKEAKALEEKLKQLAKQMGDAGQGSLSDATA